MNTKLTGMEKETIILFNEVEKHATITTYNSTLIKKLNNLCESRSDEIQLVRVDDTGCSEYVAPKKWVKVNASRILDEAVRQKMSEAMRLRRKEGM